MQALMLALLLASPGRMLIDGTFADPRIAEQ